MTYEQNELQKLGDWSSFKLQISSGDYKTKHLQLSKEQLEKIKKIFTEQTND